VILVDTSVWVEFFRRSSEFDLAEVRDLEEVVTCLPVVQEVLQGFSDERAYRMARDAMSALPIVESPLEQDVFVEAAELYRSARRAGVTPRSSIDCLIATCGIRNNLEILHRDRDFDLLAQVSPLRARKIEVSNAG
jgi:predicted nucleic acid-binding protein